MNEKQTWEVVLVHDVTGARVPVEVVEGSDTEAGNRLRQWQSGRKKAAMTMLGFGYAYIREKKGKKT